MAADRFKPLLDRSFFARRELSVELEALSLCKIK
jgi:hypothetical protein